MSFLEQIAQAYLARERQRLGIPQEQRAQAASDLQQRLGGLQAQTLESKLTPEVQAAEAEQRAAATELAKAQAAFARGEGRQTVRTQPVEDPIDVALRRKKIEAQIKRLGIAPGAGKTLGRPYAANIGGKDVMVDPTTRQPIEGMAPPGTANMRNREEQAHIISTAGAQLKAALTAAKDVIGPRAGRFQEAQEGPLGIITGGPNKAYAGVKSQLGSFEALLPILHGFRGGPQVIAQFQRSLGGGLNQPVENLHAALDAVISLAHDIETGRAVPIEGSQGGHTATDLTNNDQPESGLSSEEDAILSELMK